MKEANELTAEIIKRLNKIGFYVWRNNTVGYCNGRYMNAKKGVPDIIGYELKTGRFIAVEVKIGKDKLSAEQLEFLKVAHENNCFAIVANTFEQFLNELELFNIKFETQCKINPQ